MDPAQITASPKLRAIFAAVAVAMFALWGWSFVPVVQTWGDPREDGFSVVPLFYATIFCLPAGILLAMGAIAASGKHVKRARIALFVGAGTLAIIVAFLIVQQLNNRGIINIG